MIRTLLLLALPCFAGACVGGDAGASGATARDSAGVRIVESDAPLWTEGDAWSLTPEPLLRIGVADGPVEQQLFRVGGARRLGDGSIVVVNGGTAELRRYDRAGSHLWSVESVEIARGEPWSYPVDLRPGDSIGVMHPREVRYAIHAPDGRLVRAVQLPAPAPLTPLRWSEALPDGSLIGHLWWLSDSRVRGDLQPRRQRVSHTFVRYGLEDASVDTLGWFPGSEYLVTLTATGIRGYGAAPFRWDRVQAVRADELLIAYTEAFQVLAYDASGRLRSIFRRRVEPRPVTRQEMDDYRAELDSIVRFGPAAGPMRERNEQRRDFVSFPPIHPVLDELRADAVGNVWVRHARPAGATGEREWSVLAPDGRWLGVVALPDRFRVTEIGDGYLVGVESGDFDVEYVVMYGLRKP